MNRARLALLLAACGSAGDAPGLHPSTDLMASARFTGIDEAGGALADSSLKVGALDVRGRSALGDRTPLCVGFDATLGASTTGLAYGADLYPFGIVLPMHSLFRQPAWWSACAGFGLSGVRGSVPFGWEFAGELSGDFHLGPIHMRIWGRAALVANAEARRNGTEATAGFADEYSAGFDVRLVRFRHLGEARADTRVVLGLVWSEVMGADFWGVYLGVGARPRISAR